MAGGGLLSIWLPCSGARDATEQTSQLCGFRVVELGQELFLGSVAGADRTLEGCSAGGCEVNDVAATVFRVGAANN